MHIKDTWLLRENVSRHLHELWGKVKTLADDDWMAMRDRVIFHRIVEAYKSGKSPFVVYGGSHAVTLTLLI